MKLGKKAKERDAQDAFLVEGVRMMREVPSGELLEAWVSQSFARDPAHREDLQHLERLGVTPELVTDEVFRACADTRTPQGILGVVRQRHYRPEDLLGDGTWPALVMVLENLQDPGNLGTILRTGEGAGVTGVLMSRGCADLYNPKVTRATMGSIWRMPFVYTEDFFGSLHWLKEQGVTLCAAHLQGAVDYDAPDYGGPSAFMIGNEGNGLSDEAARMADVRIRIPMRGSVESLNASIAAAVLMYEALRCRRAKGIG